MARIDIYISSLSHSRGEGKTAYAYRLEYQMQNGKLYKKEGGGVMIATKNRAVTQAAVEALRRVRKTVGITIYTDSDYFKRIFDNLEQYQRKDWKTASGKELKNCDLWRLVNMKREINPTTVKVVQIRMESQLQEFYDNEIV